MIILVNWAKNGMLHRECVPLFCAAVSRVEKRFFPFTAVHELEPLLFWDSKLLVEALGVEKSLVETMSTKCCAPEKINNRPVYRPSSKQNRARLRSTR